MTATSSVFPCLRCGTTLFQGSLVCPNCGALVYAQTLNDIAARAEAQETAGHALAAAMIWREALTLLPPASQQYQSIAQRIGMLTSRFSAGITSTATAPAAAKPAASAAGASTPGAKAPGLAGLLWVLVAVAAAVMPAEKREVSIPIRWAID